MRTGALLALQLVAACGENPQAATTAAPSSRPASTLESYWAQCTEGKLDSAALQAVLEEMEHERALVQRVVATKLESASLAKASALPSAAVQEIDLLTSQAHDQVVRTKMDLARGGHYRTVANSVIPVSLVARPFAGTMLLVHPCRSLPKTLVFRIEESTHPELYSTLSFLCEGQDFVRASGFRRLAESRPR